MGGINLGRVIIGGLLAGLVANAGDFVANAYLMADEMQVMVQRRGLDPAVVNSPAILASWVAVDFVLGLIIVWTYAAIRPRFGPGPSTAATAGLVVYAAITAVMFGFAQMGMFAMGAFLKSSIIWLVIIVGASLAGGWAYQEKSELRT